MSITQVLLFVGSIFGLIFGIKATLEFGWKDGLMWFFGCILGTFMFSIAIFLIYYIIMNIPI